ncbi:MAG: hypothetical protein QGH90_01550 [Candidatus Poseidoniaceae archaeon]|jgi:hypothetical protein|nr:hypothetical protein [Candidatus Poseidoniaceae archaeon]
MELLLISNNESRKLLNTPWGEVISGMEDSSLRDLRPQPDEQLHRTFPIDCEAEILDWAERFNLDKEITALAAIKSGYENKKISQIEACEGILHLLRWSSYGYWEAWEGRSYLYFDLLLEQPAIDIQQLYEADTWRVIRQQIGQLTATEYSEAVVLDWMNRRKELEQTLDEKSDPRILPTMQSHTRLSTTLHHAITRWNEEEDVIGILGREHLEAAKWGHKEWRISQILKSGLP